MVTRRATEYDPDSVVTYSREEFLTEVWDYEPGQHVTILGATRNGKTHLAFELLEQTASPDLQALVIVMKPRDHLVSAWAKAHKDEYRVIRDWPPSKVRDIGKKPTGWVLWPKVIGDPDYEDVRHARIFMRAIRDCYDTGERIVFADEVVSLEREYNYPEYGVAMRKQLERVWSKGGSMECGLWSASQRPANISLFAYQAQHLFLSRDPDENNQKRYGEIGGIDPMLVRELTARLKMYQWLYIHRDDQTLCIVDRN